MPYPESCPECGSQFRNTGTHFTARRNEVGRHVILELGCQNTNRRYWWDFTAGQLADDSGKAAPVLVAAATSTSNGSNGTHGTHPTPPRNGHESLAELDLPESAPPEPTAVIRMTTPNESAPIDQSTVLKDAFVRQLQLDRLTLRQMRSLLMSDEARRAIEVAVGATEATYERLALILFGVDLPQLLGKAAVAPAVPTMSAEERLELQREKARIRARLRRAAIKAAKQTQ